MPARSFLVLTLLVACAPVPNQAPDFQDYMPAGVRITWEKSPDSGSYPARCPRPMANVTFEDTTKTFARFIGEPGKWDMHPTFTLSLYPRSMEAELAEIIRVSAIHSNCIPIFFAKNEEYFAVTSPCFHSGGCGTEACQADLASIIAGARKYLNQGPFPD